jgi:AsmA protein
LRAGELVIKDIPVKQLGLAVSARDGDVRLNDLRAELLDGSLQGGMSVDVRGKQPVLDSQLALNNLNTEALLAPWVKSPVLSGRSSLHFDVSAQGNDRDTLLRQALGQLKINMAEGVLHGVNLNQLVADALRQKVGDFTALMPDYETRLPKALTQDTALRDLLANMTIENGHLVTPDMKSNSDAGQFSAKGNIDLVTQSFDYRFGVVLTSLADHKYLKGTEWPVRCRGSVDVPAKDWCRPDGNAIGEVLRKAGGVALREKATEKLGEKLGVPSASEEEVKKKAQEKVNQQINRQLDKWLNRDKKAAPAPETPAAETPAPGP